MVSVSNVASLGEKFRELQKTFKDLEMARIPLVEDTAAKESCIDQLVDSLKQEPASTQCVFSCQAGQGRTTLGQSERPHNFSGHWRSEIQRLC